MRFGELQPEGVENKLFDYHLKIVLRDGLAEKSEDGKYRLTEEGRRLGLRVFRAERYSLAAYTGLFLIVRRLSDKAWLMYRRKAHPMIDKTGFMHATPVPSELIYETAKRELLEKTGLQADFKRIGGGLFRLHNELGLESFTHFEVMLAEDVEGRLENKHETAEYYWEETPDFSDASMIPNMPSLAEAYESGEEFFIDERIDY